MEDSSQHKPSFMLMVGLITVVFCLLVGVWAVAANLELYTHQAPFYDSMSYLQRMHLVMSLAQNGQWAEAFQFSYGKNTTVFLPHLIAIGCSLFVEPSRSIGVWIQIGELLALLLSVQYFLVSVRKCSAWTALALSVPFLLTLCLYKPHGGLSDYRMDLSLYLMLGVTSVWLLTAISTNRIWHYAVLGVAAAACCLFRATAPVYLILMLGPVALSSLLFFKQRQHRLVGMGLSVLIAAVGSLWFYLMNFDYLHYYYAIWNVDAKAQLPLEQSVLHLLFLCQHIGWFVVAGLLGLYGLHRFDNVWAQLKGCFKDPLIWFAVWIGIVPVALLVLRGAGLNPFVCMPAIFGVTLAAILPLTKMKWRFTPPTSSFLVTSVMLVCVCCCVVKGWEKHSLPSQTMAAHQAVLDCLEQDSQQQRLSAIHATTTFMHQMSNVSLVNTVLFDSEQAAEHPHRLKLGETPLTIESTFQLAAPVEFARVTGESDDEKIDALLQTAGQEINYLIVPDQATCDYIAKQTHPVINHHSQKIRQRVYNSPNWQRVAGSFQISPHETVEVYRNQLTSRRMAMQTADKQQDEKVSTPVNKNSATLVR